MKIESTILIWVILICTACDPNRVYEQNQDLESALWHADQPVSFEFAIANDSLLYNLHLNVRNGIAYPFHNLYVKYDLRDSTERSLKSELKEVFLSDPKTGKPYGDGLGDLFDHRFPLLLNHKFDYTGMYKIEIQQFMRLDSIPMIVSVGLRVERSEPID